MTTEPTGLGTWAIVELFGHQQIGGYVSEEQIAGSPMLRVDVPAARVEGEGDVTDPFTRYFGAKAIYALTPCSEQHVRQFVDYYRPKDIPVYLPQLMGAEALAIGAGDDPDDDGMAPF